MLIEYKIADSSGKIKSGNSRLGYGPLLHALAPLNAAIQLLADCEPKTANPLRLWSWSFFWIIVKPLPANAGDANIPITATAAASAAVIERIAVFSIKER